MSEKKHLTLQLISLSGICKQQCKICSSVYSRVTSFAIRFNKDLGKLITAAVTAKTESPTSLFPFFRNVDLSDKKSSY